MKEKTTEEKYELLKSQVVWAVTHYGTVDTDGIMLHLQSVLNSLECNTRPFEPDTPSEKQYNESDERTINYMKNKENTDADLPF